MKTYEEMARDVLKRRDEELLKTQSFETVSNNALPEVVYPAPRKKRGLLSKIAVPCAAAVLVGAVGVTVWKNSPYGERYAQSAVAELEPENGALADITDAAVGKPDIAVEKPDIAVTPSISGETSINIIPLGRMYDHSQPIQVKPDLHEDNGLCKFVKRIPYTIEELNDFYGIEFDKLGKVYSDWSESYDDLGITVAEYPSVSTESYAASGSREILDTKNFINYVTPQGAEISVTAQSGASIPDMSEYGISEKDYSFLNGHRAVVASAEYDGETLYGAVIEMNGALVSIESQGQSEDEFTLMLRRFTSNSNCGENNIIIHDMMPDYFRGQDPFGPVCGNIFDDLTFEPYNDIKDLNRFYGLEFDRLTRLHGDWEAQHGDLGIYTRTEEDEFTVSHEIVWTRNHIFYTLPNTAELNVSAQRGSLPPIAVGSFEDGTPKFDPYSVVNGFTAMIYRSGDSFDERVFPNGDTRFGAVVEMGGTLVHLSAAGLTEEEFLSVLDEYTAPYEPSEKPNTSFLRRAVEDSVSVLEEIPEFLANESPFGAMCGNIFDGYAKRDIGIEEANELYNIEFDRLGKLHKDWEEKGKDSIKVVECFDEELYALGTYNCLHYITPNGSEIYVRAQLGRLPTPETHLYDASYINGLYAVIYRETNEYDEKEYPNDNARFGAMIDFGGVKAEITSVGLTEEEFLRVLDEYTK